MMETDPFLKERWEEKAANEHGEEAGGKGVDLYYSFLERGQKNPDLKPLTESLQHAIGDYADSIIRLSQTRHSGEDYQSIQIADAHRKITHDALIGAVNAISRWYGKRKIDNKWRSDIIGLDRKDLGVWALSIARHVLGKEVEE